MKSWAEKQSDHIKSSSPIALAGGSFVLMLVYFYYSPHQLSYLATWCAFTLCWNLLTFSTAKNLKVYTVARWFSSALWVFPSLVILPKMPTHQQAVWVIIVVAMCAGSVMGNVFSRRLSILSVATYILPISLFPFFHATNFSPLFSALGIVFGFVLSSQAIVLNRFLKNEFDLKLVNQELSLANERKAWSMVKHERLVNLSQVVGGVAHEINNPLSIIIGYAENLQDAAISDRLSNKSVISDSEKILNAAERASNIIKSLRKIASEGATTAFESYPLSELLKESVSYFKSRILKSGIKMQVDEVDSDLNVLCQSNELLQAIMNLLGNSIDALDDLDEKWIRIQVETSSEQVMIHFTDSGLGIPDDLHKMIMQPFFTTKEIGKGSGLGLSLASSIVESHGGRLLLNSKSQNTSFTIVLPRLSKLSDSKVA